MRRVVSNVADHGVQTRHELGRVGSQQTIGVSGIDLKRRRVLAGLRGKIDLIYIDPPFDSRADYRTKLELAGADVEHHVRWLDASQLDQLGEKWTSLRHPGPYEDHVCRPAQTVIIRERPRRVGDLVG